MPATVMPRRFTVDEYYRMSEVGILDPEERVELIDGAIIRMEPIDSPHAGIVNRLTRIFVRGVGDRGVVSIQNPARLSDLSEPKPDVAVVRPRDDDYIGRHPRPADILLIVEVSNSSATFDRHTKAPLYATFDIPEYWLVDIRDGVVEVYREPVEGRYREVTRHLPGGRLSPLAFPELKLPIEELLP